MGDGLWSREQVCVGAGDFFFSFFYFGVAREGGWGGVLVLGWVGRVLGGGAMVVGRY